jgi:hypothetical protein
MASKISFIVTLNPITKPRYLIFFLGRSQIRDKSSPQTKGWNSLKIQISLDLFQLTFAPKVVANSSRVVLILFEFFKVPLKKKISVIGIFLALDLMIFGKYNTFGVQHLPGEYNILLKRIS